MKEKYLIAVDLDETLLANFNQIDYASFEVLKQLSHDHYVVIATGRPLRSSIYYYNLLELTTPIINYNGALVQNPTDPSFPKQYIEVDRHDLFQLLADNRDIIQTAFCEVEDDVYLDRETDYIVPYLHSRGNEWTEGPLHKTVKENPSGAIIFSDPHTEQIIDNYVREKFNGKYRIRFWYPNELVVISEFYNPVTSKGKALKFVADYLNVPYDRVIAIGDGENDAEMIAFAAVGAAMADGSEHAKQASDVIIPPQSESGVAQFLKTFFKLT